MTQLDMLALLESNEEALIRCNADLFDPAFLDWFKDNEHVWEAFKGRANQHWNAGRKHYSARTIVHWLRDESAIRQVGGEWKINDHVSPDLGRLWMLVYPERKGFFETRVQAESSKRAA